MTPGCLQRAARIGLSPFTTALPLNPFPAEVAAPIRLSPPRALPPPAWPILTPLHPLPLTREVVPTEPPELSLFHCSGGGGGGWHEALVLVWLPLAAPIGLSPLLILTLRGPKCVLVVSTEPPDDLSCLTTPGVGRPRDGAVARAVDQAHPDALRVSLWGGGGRISRLD